MSLRFEDANQRFPIRRINALRLLARSAEDPKRRHDSMPHHDAAHQRYRRATLIAALTSMAAPAFAQGDAADYPHKPIKIIVPFAPGGSVEVVARILGQKLTEAWSQPVVVESRPGAATIIGTDAAAKSRPDGYTLLIAVSNHATNPALNAKLPYDTLKDFEPISLVARTPIVAYVNPKFGPKDLKELVAYAKANPDTVNFGSAGAGSMTHLTGELLKRKTGASMAHVLYKGGTPAVNDVLAGHIPLTFATVGQALPQYQAKQLRALGVSSAKRYASIPEVPTFREQGIDIVATEWYGLFAPAGTPKPIIDKLNAEVRRIMGRPDLGDRLNSIEPVGSTAQELDALVRSEMNLWGPLIRELGLTAN
jgi:tripartite-type tricarboxylate transporter receptor subunit TctC